MRVKVSPLTNKRQTARAMYRMIAATANDLDRIGIARAGQTVRASDLALAEWHTFVRQLPYRIDPKPREIIARPMYGVLFGSQSGIDCKKKTILISAWLHRHRIPYRLIASSRRPDKRITHVFPQFYAGGNWINADATYAEYYLGQPKHLTAVEILQE